MEMLTIWDVIFSNNKETKSKQWFPALAPCCVFPTLPRAAPGTCCIFSRAWYGTRSA